jgi:hypothetical protein
MQGAEGAENARAVIGSNSRLTREELETAFKERTRAQRINENTPFDLRWQWEVWLSNLPPNAKLLAFAIRIYGNPDGSGSHPSLNTLEQLTGLSRRCIQDNLRLIEFTFVGKERGKGRAPNRYTLAIPGETLHELAKVIDFHSRATVAPIEGRSEATSSPQSESVAGQPLPHNPVVGQIDNRSRLLVAPNITKDITEEEKRKGPPASSALGKLAVSIAAGFTVATPAAAASSPVMPPTEQVHEAPAECWQTPKAQQAAALDIHELRAQRQVWMTPTGFVEVAGAFKAELIETFPLVDLTCGLATAAANVQPARGAIAAMQTIRREFGYMQQREKAKQSKASSAQPGRFKSFADIEAERVQKFIDACGSPSSG